MPLTAPIQWSVRGLAWLPDAVRPGLFLAVAIVLVSFIVFHNGIARLWHGSMRIVAVAIDGVVGLVLLPEFVVTRHRRANGQAPGARVQTIGRYADGALSVASGLYARHHTETRAWTRLPWRTAVVVVLASGVAWMVMVHAPANGGASRTLSGWFDRWHDVEAWAGVDPDRLAAPGPGIRGADVASRYVTLPEQSRLSYGANGDVALKLGQAEGGASGVAVLRNASGATIGTETFSIVPGTATVAKVHVAPPARRRANRDGKLPVVLTVRITDQDGIRAAVTSQYSLVPARGR